MVWNSITDNSIYINMTAFEVLLKIYIVYCTMWLEMRQYKDRYRSIPRLFETLLNQLCVVFVSIMQSWECPKYGQISGFIQPFIHCICFVLSRVHAPSCYISHAQSAIVP